MPLPIRMAAATAMVRNEIMCPRAIPAGYPARRSLNRGVGHWQGQRDVPHMERSGALRGPRVFLDPPKLSESPKRRLGVAQAAAPPDRGEGQEPAAPVVGSGQGGVRAVIHRFGTTRDEETFVPPLRRSRAGTAQSTAG